MKSVNESRDFWSASFLPPHRYSSEMDKAMKRAIEATSEESEGWTARGRKNGVDLFTRKETDPDSLSLSDSLSIKGTGIVTGASSACLIQLFIDTSDRTRNDPMAGPCRIVEEIDRLTRVEMSEFKAPWPVTPRDLVACGRVMRVREGRSAALLNFATSVQHHECPVRASHVRATLNFYGLKVTPLQSNEKGEKRCHVVFVANSSAGGSLPVAVTNQTQYALPMCIANIQKYVLSHPKEIERIHQGLPVYYAQHGFQDIDEDMEKESDSTVASALPDEDVPSPSTTPKIDGVNNRPLTLDTSCADTDDEGDECESNKAKTVSVSPQIQADKNIPSNKSIPSPVKEPTRRPGHFTRFARLIV